MAKQTGYVTFIVHCPDCHQRLSPTYGETVTTYSHDNPNDCSGEGADIELPTVSVEQLQKLFSTPKRTSKKKAK